MGESIEEQSYSYLSHLFNPTMRESVVDECFSIINERIKKPDIDLIQNAWNLTNKIFTGNFSGYRACNTEYHDYNHTIDVFSASVRLLDGAFFYHKHLSPSLELDLYISAMLHDSGYIQELDDTEGTGAKYTKTHVSRSIQFALKNKETFKLSDFSVNRIARLIAATDLSLDFDSIAFLDDDERFAAKILATADLLGQMADRTYLEKLLFLYYEFSEAGFPGYETEFDILKKTLGFYEMTKERLFIKLSNVSALAEEHFKCRYGIDKNLYIEAIERQMDYLRSIINDTDGNFRKKLKRIDLEEVSRTHKRVISS